MMGERSSRPFAALTNQVSALGAETRRRWLL